MDQLFRAIKNAGKSLVLIPDKTINKVINNIADKAIAQSNYILSENQKDLDRMDKNDPKYDRLMLTKERIEGIASDLRNVAGLPSPLGRTLMETIRPNGMKISKISVPFGVVGIIYEARPNVSFDVFSLCFKSGNACLLKGGSDAQYSNAAIVGIIRECLKEGGIDPDICILLPPEKEYVIALLNAVNFVDLIIPRGSRGLIDFVRDNSKIPILETGAGICHTFFDESGDKEKGWKIINNAKTRRVSVCNALDCLIIHEKRLTDLPYLCHNLIDSNVTIYADSQAYSVLQDNYPPGLLQQADETSFGMEFLDYKMSIKTVKDINEAMEHIDKHGSKHSECIISENTENMKLFEKMVDAACVYVNVPTSFTDGAQFGLGAEIGISTQKLHARGPMALEELTSYKWIINGDGQIRK